MERLRLRRQTQTLVGTSTTPPRRRTAWWSTGLVSSCARSANINRPHAYPNTEANAVSYAGFSRGEKARWKCKACSRQPLSASSAPSWSTSPSVSPSPSSSSSPPCCPCQGPSFQQKYAQRVILVPRTATHSNSAVSEPSGRWPRLKSVLPWCLVGVKMKRVK